MLTTTVIILITPNGNSGITVSEVLAKPLCFVAYGLLLPRPAMSIANVNEPVFENWTDCTSTPCSNNDEVGNDGKEVGN